MLANNILLTFLAAYAWLITSGVLAFDQFMSSRRRDDTNKFVNPQGQYAGGRTQPRLGYTQILNTPSGRLRGKIVPVDNNILEPVVQFLGIPYAKPPTGKRRWKKPEPTPKWSKIFNATEFGSVCPQVNSGPLPSVLLPLWFGPSLNFRLKRHVQMGEDCLYLNIYIPKSLYPLGSPSRTKKLPVMIFFHGNTFSEGSGNLYDGSVLASYGQVIVVTFNYRIGVLGFLSTMDSAAFGNYGLWDQLELLRWVSVNIGAFGGDKQRVTVFGSGAGAASIGMLMLSHQTEGNRRGNISEGFFKRAILQSGTALAPWAVVRNARKNAGNLARQLGCNNNTRMAIVECLKTKTWRELVSVKVKPEPYNLAFGPVVDGASRLLSEAPATLMKRHELLNYDVMIGVSQGEGFGYVRERLGVAMELLAASRGSGSRRNAQTIYKAKDFAIDVKKYVDAFYDRNNVDLSVVEDVVQFMYTNWQDQSDPILLKRSLMDLYTDRQWVEPAVQVAEIESDLKHAAYFYTFYHQTGSGIDRSWVKAGHGEELPFVFGAPLLRSGYPLFPYNFTMDDKTIATAMMRYWANFADNGDPMVGKKQEAQFLVGVQRSTFQDITWPRYYRSDRRHLQISTTPAIESHYRAQKVAFWRSFIPRLTGTSCGAVDCYMAPPDDSDLPDISPFGNDTLTPRNPVPFTWKPNEKSMRSVKNMADKSDSSSDGGGLSLQLSITLAVGFVLLFVNIIAFAVVSYHKERDKFRIEKLQSELKAYRQQGGGAEPHRAKPLASAHTTLESCIQSEHESSEKATLALAKVNGVHTSRSKAKISSGSEMTEQMVPLASAKDDLSNMSGLPKETSSHHSLHFKSISPRKGGDGAMVTEASSAGSISDVAFINSSGDCNGAPPSYWPRGEGAGERQTLPFPSRPSYHQATRITGESSCKGRFNDPVRCHSALGVCYERGEFDLRQDPVREDAESEFSRSRSTKEPQFCPPPPRSRIAGSAMNLTHGAAYDHHSWAASLPRPRISDGLTPSAVQAAIAPSTSAVLRSVTTKL